MLTGALLSLSRGLTEACPVRRGLCPRSSRPASCLLPARGSAPTVSVVMTDRSAMVLEALSGLAAGKFAAPSDPRGYSPSEWARGPVEAEFSWGWCCYLDGVLDFCFVSGPGFSLDLTKAPVGPNTPSGF